MKGGYQVFGAKTQFDENAKKIIVEKYFDIIHYDNLDNMQSKLDEMYNKGEKSFGYYDGGRRRALIANGNQI